MAKRAKVPVIVIEDDPTVSAGGAPETNLPDPTAVLQSSPQRSPQRKYMVCFPLLGAHGYSLFAAILLLACVGAEQPHQERPDAAPDMPRESSPARENPPTRESSPAREKSPARDSTSDPPAAEIPTAEPGTGTSCF